MAVQWEHPTRTGGWALGVWVYSLEDRSEKLIQPGNYIPFAWSPDGTTVYATKFLGLEILAIKLEDPNHGRKVIDLPSAPWGASLAPDGRKIILGQDEMNSDVWMIQNFDPAVAVRN
jgi:sugar lactone lactonase YvrE